MSAPRFDLGPVKEPLGFIKVLEWIFSIFAFATCGGYSGKTDFDVSCPPFENETLSINFAYPFRLNSIELSQPKCNISSWANIYLLGDFSSSAQFFVTFAVFVFLYCTAVLVLYLGYMHLYRGAGKLPMADFIITVIVAFLWLVSTSAWAKALTDIKVSTGPNMVDEIKPCTVQPIKCIFKEIRSMGSLNVSVVVGFLNLILWAGNAWFVYKETSLHNPPAPTENPAGAS